MEKARIEKGKRLRERYLAGSRNLDRMKAEITTVVSGVVRAINPQKLEERFYPVYLGQHRFLRLGDDDCSWRIFLSRGYVVAECYIGKNLRLGYHLSEQSGGNAANVPCAELVRTVYDSLDTLLAELAETIPTFQQSFLAIVALSEDSDATA